MDWDDEADRWDEDEAVRAYARAAFESLSRVCGERGVQLGGARAFDFGCGTGLLVERLAPVCEAVVALDTSPRMIERLREKVERLKFGNVQTTTDSLERAASSGTALLAVPFDLVTCSSVCAFLDDYPRTAALLAGLLRPGGLFVQWDWELDPNDAEPFGLSRQEVQEALFGAGLEAVQVETAFEVPLGDVTMRPLMGVGRAPRETG